MEKHKFNVQQYEQQLKDMLARLNKMYDKEEELKFEFKKLTAEWNQLREEKELLQSMIMFQSNKLDRVRNFRR